MDNNIPFIKETGPKISPVETKYTIYEIKEGHKFLETLKKEAKKQKAEEETRTILTRASFPFSSFSEYAEEDFFEIEDSEE